MFFYLSKIFWFVAAPSHFLILSGLAGLVFRWFKWRRIGGFLVVFSIVGMAFAAFSPLSLLLALPLEERFQPPDPEPETVDGVVVLGGAINTLVSSHRGRMALADSGERVANIAALARRYPTARILYSGGSVSIFRHTTVEADVAAVYFESFGIAEDRILLERKAKNTWQNAVYSKELAKPVEGETWLLVTSAFHMPRAMGVFRQAGWPEMVPWPVDYRMAGPPDTKRIRTNAGLGVQLIDLAAKEWIGLLAYRVTGRTGSLFPAPVR